MLLTKMYANCSPPSGRDPEACRLVLHTCGNGNKDGNCQIVERMDQYKYLGVVIDSKLRWEQHVQL